MIDAATIDAMVASGCTAEQIGAVVKAALAADEARRAAIRAKAAAKKRRQRAQAAVEGELAIERVAELSPDVPGTMGDNWGQTGTLASPLPSPCPPSPVTPNPLYPQPSPLHTTAGGRERGPNPVVVLGSVLDPLNAKRFADHCAEKGRRLSSGQAEAIVAELTAVRDAGGNPVDAVQIAISRGWTSIRRDWLAGNEASVRSGSARASPGRLDVAGVFDELAAEMGLIDVGKRGKPGGTAVAGDASADQGLLGAVR